MSLTREPDTLVSLLLNVAETQPNLVLYNFLDSNLETSAVLTASDLLREAAHIAAVLDARGMAGEPVLLLYPHGPEQITALFGAMLAACVPVPVTLHQRLDFTGLTELIVVTGSRVVLGGAETAVRLEAGGLASLSHCLASRNPAHSHDLEFIVTRRETASAGEITLPRAGAIALIYPGLQDGSAARPVALSHANLLASVASLASATQMDGSDVMLTCLDLADGMALVLHVLMPLYLRLPAWFLGPEDFLNDSRLWLRALSRHRCSVTSAPAAALALCVHNSPGADGDTDLGQVRLICVGGDYLSPCVIDLLLERNSRFGINNGHLFFCYGLSAVCAFVAGRRGIKTVTIDSVQYLSLGTAAPDTQLMVRCEDEPPPFSSIAGSHGTVVVESAMTGLACSAPVGGQRRDVVDYFADLATASRAGTGLRMTTGDTGMILEEELYCVGRLGNRFALATGMYQCEVIESVVMQSFFCRQLSRCVVLFPDGSGRLVLLAECARRQLADRWQGMVAAMSEQVARATGLRPSRVLLLRPGSLPVSVSGVTLRDRCLASLQDGSLMLRLLPVRGK